jgi:transketolase
VIEKWRSFRWAVLEIGGHDIGQIDKALDQADAIKGQPVFIVAHTIKGKGVSFMENDPEWHGKAPKPAEAVRGIRELVGSEPPDWAQPIIAELEAMEKK